MPQASNRDRYRYKKRFGDIGCEHAIRVLENRGYSLEKDWTWTTPEGKIPTEDDLFLVGFLIDEWDFGGLSNVKGEP